MPENDFIVGMAVCNEPAFVLEDTVRALATSSARPRRVLVVDNSDDGAAVALGVVGDLHGVHLSVVRPEHNLGCAGSWNLLHKLAGDTPIVIINADLAVAPDTFEQIVTNNASVTLAFGFGCFQIHKDVRDRIGGFDESFWPVYFEDVDYRRRMKLAHIVPWEWPINVVGEVSPGRSKISTGIVHGKHEDGAYQGWTGEELKRFQARVNANRDYYIKKWGGTPYEETYTQPFDGARQ